MPKLLSALSAIGEDAVVGLEREVRAALVEQLANSGSELVVADTHPGVGSFSLDLLLRADHILLVTTPEPTSMTDSYALFKVLVEREAEQAQSQRQRVDAVSRPPEQDGKVLREEPPSS